MNVETTARIVIEVSALGLSDEEVRTLQGNVNRLQAGLRARVQRELPEDVRVRVGWHLAVDGRVVSGAGGGNADDPETYDAMARSLERALAEHFPEDEVRRFVDEKRREWLAQDLDLDDEDQDQDGT